MSITNLNASKKITNKKDELKISIRDILDLHENGAVIYRDILKYLTTDVKESILKYHHNNTETVKTSFRIRDLVKWLLENNRQIMSEFRDKPRMNKGNWAHTKTPMITKRVDHLIKLQLVEKNEEKVPSRRNSNIPTELFEITNLGRLVALTLDLKYNNRMSNEHKIILKYMLERWLEIIPDSYKNVNNIHYYFIKYVIEKCLCHADNIVEDFFVIIMHCSRGNGYFINFSDLRYKLNQTFVRHIIRDKQFQSLYNKSLDEIGKSNTIVNNFQYSADISSSTNWKNLITSQFKLDVESNLEKRLSECLKIDPIQRRKYLWQKKNDCLTLSTKKLLEEEIKSNGGYLDVTILDYDIKYAWEILRNENLSYLSAITMIGKCQKCLQIYPMTLDIEKDSLDEMKCKLCNNSSVTLYDIDDEVMSDYYLVKWIKIEDTETN